MRERVEAVGGLLVAGPVSADRFSVTARFPIPAGESRGPVIRVVIADDEPLARDGLAALIGSAPDIEVVDVAADGAQALDGRGRTHRPDVIVMDIRMPDIGRNR